MRRPYGILILLPLGLMGCAALQPKLSAANQPTGVTPSQPVTAPAPAPTDTSPPVGASATAPNLPHGNGSAATDARSSSNRVASARNAQPSASSKPSAKPVATVPVRPTAPALDLTALESRLRETHAMGVFTKISLKNQVDDLLTAFRGYHGGKRPPELPTLRQRYDVLVIKVLSLLQDGDPQLASAIVASRESLWNILADPDKFQNAQLGS